MANIGKGKARLEINVPDGVPARMDALAKRLSARLPEADLRDRGDVLDLLVTWAEESEVLAVDLDVARAEVEEARAARDEALAQRDEALRQIAESDQAFRRRVDIGAEALDVLAQAHAAGVARGDIIDAAQLCLRAGVPPHRIVAGIEESGAAGLLAYADKLGAAVADGQRTAIALGEEIAARRQAVATLKAAADEVQREADQAVAAARDRARQVEGEAERLERLLAEAGMYVEFVRGQLQGGRVDDAPALFLRMLAGVVLLASVESHGDAVLHLPAGGPAGRLLDVPVALSEVPYVLAPAAAYQKMREAQAARTTRARELAAAPAGGGGGDG